MKKLLITLLIPVFAFAQDGFDKIPLKGKIATYTISEISGDSLKPSYEVMEKVVFDKQGRVISSLKQPWLRRNSTKSFTSELNIYKGNNLTNYKCFCEDINAFVKEFVIRNKEELKNEPRGGTPYGPTKFVKITTFDKNNNAISVSNYSESGYKVSEEKSTFTANKVTRTERYNFDDVIDETHIITYTKSGRDEVVLKKNRERGNEKYIYTYDTDDNRIEIMAYYDGILKEHTKFTVVAKDDYKEFITHNILYGTEQITKRIYYNAKGLEIKIHFLDSKGEVYTRKEYTYNANGILESESNYHENDVLSSKFEFIVDKNNNWVELKKTQLEHVRTKDERTPGYKVYKFVRKIDYLK